MAVIRHEKQEYATVAALVAETIVPQSNDSVYVEALKRTFDWIQGSTATHDGSYVIDQTSSTASGRWQASVASSVHTGTGTTDNMDNGQSSIISVTVTGANPSKANSVAITNASTFPTNVYVSSAVVTANDTVKVVVENQSGATVTGFSVAVTVLEF